MKTISTRTIVKETKMTTVEFSLEEIINLAMSRHNLSGLVDVVHINGTPSELGERVEFTVKSEVAREI